MSDKYLEVRIVANHNVHIPLFERLMTKTESILKEYDLEVSKEVYSHSIGYTEYHFRTSLTEDFKAWTNSYKDNNE